MGIFTFPPQEVYLGADFCIFATENKAAENAVFTEH